jgi:vesicle coat complex subunit
MTHQVRERAASLRLGARERAFVSVFVLAGGAAKEGEFARLLESKDMDTKINTLKAIIMNTLNGESYPKLLMPVIKFCLNSDNHLIKKLLLLYWEVVDKKTKEGNLLHEMILVW